VRSGVTRENRMVLMMNGRVMGSGHCKPFQPKVHRGLLLFACTRLVGRQYRNWERNLHDP
jgi:hypothetical protein